MEVLLPWQQIIEKSILSLYLAQYVLCDNTYMTDLPGCYGSTVTRDKKVYLKKIILDFCCLRETGVDFVGA